MTAARPGLRKLVIDNEAKGKVRVWKAAALKNYERFYKACKKVDAAGEAFAFKGRKGQERALGKMRKALNGYASLDSVDFERPYALWSILRPRDSIVKPGTGGDPGLWQNATVVEYSLIDAKTWWTGLWTIEVPDHALGRLVQRDREADITAAITEAHKAALNGSLRQLVAMGARPKFFLPAGRGVFLCTLAKTIHEDGRAKVWVIARTWLHHDQMFEEQEDLIIKPAGEKEPFMGVLLCPAPFLKSTETQLIDTRKKS